MKKHRFHSKTSEGSWTVECKETGGSFSTEMWRLGKIPDQKCPCCNGSMTDEWYPKSDAQIRQENEAKLGDEVYTGRFSKPLDFVTDFRGEDI